MPSTATVSYTHLYPVKPGIDLCAEHERHLVEEYFRRPVIITDYPKEIKAFYMKQNEMCIRDRCNHSQEYFRNRAIPPATAGFSQ